MTRNVLNRVHEYDNKQKKRRSAVLKTAVPVCGAFAIAGAAVLANFAAKPPVSDNSAIIAGSGESLTESGASEQSDNVTMESERSATSTSTDNPAKPNPIEYSKTPDGLDNAKTNLPFINHEEQLSPEKAARYYNIDVFALDKKFDGLERLDGEFTIRKNEDRTVDDGNFVEYRNSEGSELLLALFRKKLKWQPAADYTPYDFAGTDVYFFKDSAESPETRAVFEVNGTQITLLYSGPNEKTLYNAIKIFVNSEGSEQISDTAPIITGGSDIAAYN